MVCVFTNHFKAFKWNQTHPIQTGKIHMYGSFVHEPFVRPSFVFRLWFVSSRTTLQSLMETRISPLWFVSSRTTLQYLMETRISYTELAKIYFWTATIHKWYHRRYGSCLHEPLYNVLWKPEYRRYGLCLHKPLYNI